jgi:hypothetical protein
MQEVTGSQWTFPDGREYTFIDKKLPFGSKLAPGIFHRLSQAMRRMMSRRGFTIVAYYQDGCNHESDVHPHLVWELPLRDL